MTIYNEDLNPLFAKSIDLAPAASELVLVIRHSTREPIPPGSNGDEQCLTPVGIELAERLGRLLAARRFTTVHSSTIHRCVETAEALCRGATQAVALHRRSTLVSPAALIEVDGLGMAQETIANPVDCANALLTFYYAGTLLDVPPVVSEIFRCAFSTEPTDRGPSSSVDDRDRLRIIITHDDVIGFTLAFLLRRERITFEDLPWMLEGFFLWRNGRGTFVLWRGEVYPLRDTPVLAIAGG